MLRSRYPIGWLTCLLLATTAVAVRADTPPDPLRLVPDEADLLVKVEQPRQLIEAVTTLGWFGQLQALKAFRELLDSTGARRFYQLVAYFEKQLGLPWPQLLDRLAGGGAVVAVKFGPDPAPVVLVIQGKDEKLLRKFVSLTLELAEQEQVRQEAKERFEKGSYRDLETVRIGKEFHAAVAGSALLISNTEKALHYGIDRSLDGGKKSMAGVAGVAEARKLLPADPLVWMWLNLETIRKAPQAKEVFAQPRNDANLTVLFGGWLDVAGRAPFLCAGFYRQPNGFLTTWRMPRGREGMFPVTLAAHLPSVDAAGKTGGALPLLEPKGVLYSTSYFLDVSKFWEHRAKLLNEQQLKGLEEFDKNSGRYLAGTRFSKLLGQAGPHQRIVVAHQSKPGYQTVPAQRIPAFAFIVDLREPETYGRSMEVILRGVALLAGTQIKLKLVEEKHGDVTIVGYRFPEDAQFPKDKNDIRFNFSPCFTTVGDQFFVSSTLELSHELVDLLQKEAKGPVNRSSAAVQSRFYAGGGAVFLEAIEDQLFAQTILQQALPPAAARQQVQALIDLVRRLGVLQTEANYGANDFRYDIRLQLIP